MATKKTTTTEAADAVTEATETTATATTEATTTTKAKTTSLCQVKVKSLQVGKTLLGRGATFRLATAAAAKLEEAKKVTIIVEK